MPLSGQRGHVVLHDRTRAAAAFRCEHVKVIIPAVRPAFSLVETLLAKLFAALRAEKMFRVPRLLQRCHAFLKNIIIFFFIITVNSGCRVSQSRRLPYVQYGSVAVRAPGREQVVVVRFAVRPAVTLEEIACTQLLRAMRACKVLRMPCLAQRRDHLADDRLVARRAAALLSCVHALPVHLGRQAPEHAVQRRRRVYRLGRVTRSHRTRHLLAETQR